MEINNLTGSFFMHGGENKAMAVLSGIDLGLGAMTISAEGVERLVMATDKYFSTLGYTREQFVSECARVLDTVHPEDRALAEGMARSVLTTGRGESLRLRSIKRDGEIISVRASASSASCEDSDEKLLLFVITDISGTVEAESTAARSSAQLRSIMENINGGVTATVLEGSNTSFLFSNDRYYAQLGYTREQFAQEVKTPFDLVHPDDRERVVAETLRGSRTRQPFTVTYRVIRRDGAVRWLRSNISIMDYPEVDAPVQLAVANDITGMRDAQQREQETMEQLRAIINNVNGGVSAATLADGKIGYIYVNDEYYAMFGYTREQFEAELPGGLVDLIDPADLPMVYEVAEEGARTGRSTTMEYRVKKRDGSRIWVRSNSSVCRMAGYDAPVHLAVTNDITAQKEAQEKLRVSEEQYRIAASLGDRAIARYDIRTGDYYHNDRVLTSLGYPEVVKNVPESFIEDGNIAPESLPGYIEFYERLRRGEGAVTLDSQILVADGSYRWCRQEATTIFDGDGRPAQAIIVITDITEQREKETVYRKWQQSLAQKPLDAYTLFRCNLSKDTSLDVQEGSLLWVDFTVDKNATFDERTHIYVDQCVCPEDRQSYAALMSSDSLLASYYRGERFFTLDFREIMPNGDLRWLRLTIELVEYPNSTDVEAYLLYEDIDEAKREELLAVERANTDPLTGVLNRKAFALEMEKLLKNAKTTQHAVLMLDIDGFKLLNDTLGHAAGDDELVAIADSLRSVLRHGDLLCRLGGDEFIVCLKDIPYNAVIEKKARQICLLLQKSVSPEVSISASVGIAVFPKDGEDFDSLYRSADAALYHVKGASKNGFAFFSADMGGAREFGDPAVSPAGPLSPPLPPGKRRMLVVDDNKLSRAMLTNMFAADFLVETAKTGSEALVLLRHFGAGISIVLLDLIMPGMDGFAVLERMRASVELRTIPVIVVSGQNEREIALRAIKCGAADFITKPVDPDLIHIRVQSAVSRTENERLRAQNSYLLLQNTEEVKYRTVLETTGTVVIEYDWINGIFTYDPLISAHLAGRYDSRKLWHILLSDRVADVMDVRDMQGLVHGVANDRKRTTAEMTARMKTPTGEKHWFRMSIFKSADDFQLTDKMILTFNDINDEVLSDEALRFRAERDELTGLYNRSTFLKMASALIRSRPANSLLMSVGDIDNFKMVNDRLGHAAGDRLLKLAASTLSADMAEIGGVCGRMGSDLFATVIPHTPETLLKTNRYPTELLSDFEEMPGLTCSIGFYFIDDPEIDVDRMLDWATMAKQSIKGVYGKRVAWYDEAMRKKLLTEQEITTTMESALSSGAFEIYLQPQYDHLKGGIVGAEALVRWLHPEKGVMFLPGEFIPLFEKNGFITKLDEYVWNRTAEHFRAWLDKGFQPVPVSVNVSRLDTHDPELCSKLKAIVERNRIPIQLFRLEITESLFEQDPDRLVAVIAELHRAGFLIEMDDFGSGYSSLNVLKNVNVDILKLDMRFFSDAAQNERGGVILGTIMEMARALELPVIAEGVETSAQADFLAGIGCPTVQGYLYARPMPVAEFEELLAKEK